MEPPGDGGQRGATLERHGAGGGRSRGVDGPFDRANGDPGRGSSSDAGITGGSSGGDTVGNTGGSTGGGGNTGGSTGGGGIIYTEFGGLDGVDYDCYDFATPSDAQAYFEADGGSVYNNSDGLDRNHNGLACEPGEFD